jgi:hypothetical protein
MLSICINPVRIWLIGNVVPRPSAADEMTDAPVDPDELLELVVVVLPVGLDVVVLVVGEIEEVMLDLCVLGWRGTAVLR